MSLKYRNRHRFEQQSILPKHRNNVCVGHSCSMRLAPIPLAFRRFSSDCREEILTKVIHNETFKVGKRMRCLFFFARFLTTYGSRCNAPSPHPFQPILVGNVSSSKSVETRTDDCALLPAYEPRKRLSVIQPFATKNALIVCEVLRDGPRTKGFRQQRYCESAA